MDGVEANVRRNSGSLPFALGWLAPAILTLAYPFLLAAFSDVVGNGVPTANGPRAIAGWLCLFVAMSVPLVGLGWAYRLRDLADLSDFRLCARRLAYLAIGAPPLFVFIGVTRGLVGRPFTDQSIWLGVWVVAIGLCLRPLKPAKTPSDASATSARLRIAHGVSASLILLFVAFHLTNHLSGLIGPDMHVAIMTAGRKIYRFLPVEIALVSLLLFQIGSGLTLAARWSRQPGDGFRVLQIGSGIYLASFVITHLNSALVSARAIRHIETNWAWASGAPEGLLYNSWNIRLVPHYGFGVFFVLTHLLLGLRQVVIAHGVEIRTVNRLWLIGLLVSIAVAAVIMAGLLGLRLI
jgi:hypothetical protein